MEMCGELGCGGLIPVNLHRVNIGHVKILYARARVCDKCSRVHWSDGKPVFSKRGSSIFLKNGKVIIRNKTVREMSMT